MIDVYSVGLICASACAPLGASRDEIDAAMAEVIAQMSVISEVSGRSYDGVSVHGGEKDRAPARPVEKPMVDYWRDRYNRAGGPRTRRLVLTEAKEALELARRMPIPKGQEPEYGSPQWKRYIAESVEDTGALATRFNCTRRYINMIRRAYRKDAA